MYLVSTKDEAFGGLRGRYFSGCAGSVTINVLP